MAFSFKSSFSQWSLDSVQKKNLQWSGWHSKSCCFFKELEKKIPKTRKFHSVFHSDGFFCFQTMKNIGKNRFSFPNFLCEKVPTQLDPKHRIPTEFFQHKKSAAFFETPELRLKSEWHQFGEAEACLKTPAVLSKGNFIKGIDVLFLIWKVKKLHLQKPKLGFFKFFPSFLVSKSFANLLLHTRDRAGIPDAQRWGVNILARKILTFKDKIFHIGKDPLPPVSWYFLWIWEILESVNFTCIRCEFVPSRCSFRSKSLFLLKVGTWSEVQNPCCKVSWITFPEGTGFSTHRICWWYVHAIMTREILRIKLLAFLCRFGVSRWSVPAVPTKDGNLETCIFSCAFKESEAISVPHVIWCYRCYSKKKREIHVISSKLLIPQITGHSQTHWISRDMMTFLPLFFITKKARWSTSPNFI